MACRVVVLASGGGTNLQALIDARDRGALGGGVLSGTIVSRPDAYARERARRAGVPVRVVDRQESDSRTAYTKAILAVLDDLKADLVVLAGFLYILAPVFCEVYRNRVLNVHPSLIPAFCGDGFYGLKVHKAVLRAGVKLTGATVHFVNEVCDGGPIILQKSCAVLPGDTPESLQRRVMEQCEWEILPKAVALFCRGMLRVTDGKVMIGGKESILP